MANLNETIKALEAFSVKQCQALTVDLIDGIKRDTPVDTGRARAGWEVAKEIKKIGDTGLIINEVPYIGWLEFGSDTVAPQAMVRNNIKRVTRK